MSWSLVRRILTDCVYVCVCVCVCERESVIQKPQQTVTLALSLAAAPQKESNINLTYRHSKCSWRLLPAPRQCSCFSLWAFYRANCRISCACPRPTYLNRNTWMCDRNLFHLNFREVFPCDNRKRFCPPTLVWLNKFIVNTLLVTVETFSYVRLVTKNFKLDV